MWNQETDRMFLDLREDAVLIFALSDMKLICMNPAASNYFPQTDAQTVFSDLFKDEKIDNFMKAAVSSGRTYALTLDEHPWFDGSAVMHIVKTEWDGKPAVVTAIDKRAYGPPPEALQMMKAVLTSAYFTAIRLDLQTKRASVISDKNPLMNTQAHFAVFSEYIARYAEAVIHPEDREQFLTSFSEGQLRLFLEANTSPACTVRRLCDEEYRWASFTLAAVNPFVVLLFGKDSNEQHLQQERSDRYRSELADVSQRNSYILSGVSDIFRLMLHIDLKTGETVVCSLHPDLEQYFSYSEKYQYTDIVRMLIQMVHPDDRGQMLDFSSIQAIPENVKSDDHKLSFEYRRIAPQQDPNVNSKWTRSVLTISAFENGKPTEAIYAVQDIDAQKRREMDAQRAQATLSEQFYTLIRNRYLWFIEHDYSKKVSICHRIANKMVMPQMECPFGQFFERMIMPHCHPEDYKKVALALMPLTAEENYKQGNRQITVDYRHKSENGWRYSRAEMFLQENEDGILHAMIYISDVDKEVTQQVSQNKTEHEQLTLRRKLDKVLEDSYIRFSEVDLDADTIRHYRMENNSLVPSSDELSFHEYCEQYPERYVFPEQREQFRRIFSFENILRAARENRTDLKHLFLIDLYGDQNFLWCNVAVKYLKNENGKSYAIIYIVNVNDEIEEQDARLRKLAETKEQLKENMRMNERARIRRAHVFLNIASSFQLALNQIYGALDKIERNLPETEREHHDLSTIFTAYERLSAMTVCAKDLLLLENNQLPIVKEPTVLLTLLQKIRSTTGSIIDEKHIHMVSFVTNLTEEIVMCDSRRLSFLFDNIFINVIRSLPDGASVTLRLAESPIAGRKDQAMYEFSLITHGDSVSQDIQTGLLSPIPKNDPMKSVEAAFFLNNPDYEQYNIYLSKRLIQAMDGTLEFVPMPDLASAVILRLPLVFIPKQVLFPLRKTFGKRALVWDSQQPAALATMEILRESGMQSDWQADYENICAYLQLANTQHHLYDLVVIRGSDLYADNSNRLEKLRKLIPDTPIFIIGDVEQSKQTEINGIPKVYWLRTPVFRSILARQLWAAFGDQVMDTE